MFCEVFGDEGGAPIMAKDHPALQELFQLMQVRSLMASEKSVLGQMIEPAQTAFVLLLGECLHAIYLAIYPDT